MTQKIIFGKKHSNSETNFFSLRNYVSNTVHAFWLRKDLLASFMTYLDNLKKILAEYVLFFFCFFFSQIYFCIFFSLNRKLLYNWFCSNYVMIYFLPWKGKMQKVYKNCFLLVFPSIQKKKKKCCLDYCHYSMNYSNNIFIFIVLIMSF